MRKPWIALIVGALLLGLLGVGCGGSDDNGQGGSATSASSNGAASESGESGEGSEGSESEAEESGEAEESAEGGESGEAGEGSESGETGEGGEAEESSGEAEEGSESAEPGTTAAFTTEAEQICAANKKQLKAEVLAGFKGGVSTETQLVTKIVIPSLQTRLKELEALGLPEEDEAGAQAVIDAMGKMLQELEAKPTTNIPSKEADKLANEYGMPTCSLAWL